MNHQLYIHLSMYIITSLQIFNIQGILTPFSSSLPLNVYMYHIYIYIYIYIFIYIYIYMYVFMYMVIIKYSFTIMGQKEPTIFCITFRHWPSSDTSFQKITFPEYTILQFFFHNNSVTLRYKQSTKSLLNNFNFLNDYAKVKRDNILSSN